MLSLKEMDNFVDHKIDLDWLKHVHVNLSAVKERAAKLSNLHDLHGDYKAAWLLKIVTCIDLTTLGGDDTISNVTRLCMKASRPIASDLLKQLGFDYNNKDCPIHTGAVCVYPSKIKIAHDVLKRSINGRKIKIAAVATGFPSGQYSLKTRLDEIEYAIENGADEIDIVIDRSLVLMGKWQELYEEVILMKKACGTKAHLKAILATGELVTLNNVYKASYIAMLAGADFIKTSTGKETINATLSYGIVMCRAINDFHKKFGIKVGLKPAGGIRTANDALVWLIMIKELLGNEWLDPKLFRFGASGLLGDVERTLYELATGQKAKSYFFTMG